MKKHLLLGLTISLGLTSVAQQTQTIQGIAVPQLNPALDVAVPYIPYQISGSETTPTTPYNQRPANPVQWSSFERAATETVIGTTTYDLQSNSSVQNRVINHGNGEISAVWTYSQSNNLAAPDRGTGYNFFNGTTWAVPPTARIEPSRGGWPSLGKLAGGKEVVNLHNTSIEHLMLSSNGGVGSSSWVSNPSSVGDLVWNRTKVGGANGNTLHTIAIKDPALAAGGSGTAFHGVINALVYNRSLNGGATWDIQEMVLPGLDSTNYRTMSGDSYSIDVEGDMVVVVFWGGIEPTIMAKSMDNGATWTSTPIIDRNFIYDAENPATSGNVLGISDGNGDGIPDTLTGTDGYGAVLIDHNNMVHFTWGSMRNLDDDPTGLGSYFPGTNGLMYWNEAMVGLEPVMIGLAYDIDGDGQLLGNNPDFSNGNNTAANYQSGLATMPYIAIDAGGDVYVSYSALDETKHSGDQTYRHIYIVKTNDNGCSWTMPLDVTTGNSGYSECVFGSLAKTVDNNVHLVYQRDLEPGLAVRGDEDAYDINEIVYVQIPIADIDAQEFWACYPRTNLDTAAICAGTPTQLMVSCADSYVWSTTETTNSIMPSALGIYTVNITTQCSSNQTLILANTTDFSFELIDASGLGAPSITTSATEMKICPTTTTTLMVNEVTGGAYLWDNTETTASATYTGAGTYTVSVTNCGGTSTSTIEITMPDTPVAVVTGEATVCPTNGSVVLTAGSVPSPSYIWSNGATTQMITATTADDYMVTVSNCAGSNATTYSLINTPFPTATVVADPDTSCAGTLVGVTAAGGNTYAWSNNELTNSFTLNQASESGAYTVTVTNVCGDSDVATVTVTIHALPAAPTVTHTVDANGEITFSAGAGTYKWFISGVPKPATNTYVADWATLKGKTVTAAEVDANGCESLESAGVVAIAAGINTINEVNAGVNVYPNPNNGEFVVTFNTAADYKVTVRNVLGQVVFTTSVFGDVANVNLTDVNKGLYFVNVTGKNFKSTQKVIVK